MYIIFSCTLNNAPYAMHKSASGFLHVPSSCTSGHRHLESGHAHDAAVGTAKQVYWQVTHLSDRRGAPAGSQSLRGKTGKAAPELAEPPTQTTNALPKPLGDAPLGASGHALTAAALSNGAPPTSRASIFPGCDDASPYCRASRYIGSLAHLHTHTPDRVQRPPV
jgi:hypothetical protein